jgi:CHAD domain-containing protein
VAAVETPAPAEASEPAAIEVLRGYLGAQSTAFLAQLPRLRQGHPEAAHRIRMACRRARSMLRTFEPLLDEEWAGELSARLAQFTAAVGPERDVEVVRRRLLAGFDGLGDRDPRDPGVIRARSLVDRMLQRESTLAREATLAILAGPGFHALADQIALAPAALPGRAAAREPAARVLYPLVLESFATIERRVRGLPQPGSSEPDWDSEPEPSAHIPAQTGAVKSDAIKTGAVKTGALKSAMIRSGATQLATRPEATGEEAEDEIWHKLRICAKRGRYAAEVCVPLAGADATGLAEQLTRLTEALGRQQDAAMASAVLARAAQTPRIVAPTAFALGRLLGAQRAEITRARAAFPDLWAEVSRPEHRSWLDC